MKTKKEKMIWKRIWITVHENMDQSKNKLGFPGVFSLCTGAMISAGLFILPGLAYKQVGPAVCFSYLIAGLLALAGMLNQAELVSAMPKTGGTYFYVTKSLGAAAGTVDGIMMWSAITLKSTLAVFGVAVYFSLSFNTNINITGAVFCVFFTGVNLIGWPHVTKIKIMTLLILIGVLLVYIIRGIGSIDPEYFTPFTGERGVTGIFAGAGFVFISYGGLLKVIAVADEVKQPDRDIPLGMIFSLGVTTLFYVVVVAVTVGILEPSILENSHVPISNAAESIMGTAGSMLIAAAALAALIPTACIGINVASRYLYVMAEDQILPGFLSKTNIKHKTPYIAVVFTGICMAAVLQLEITLMVKIASAILLMVLLFSCLSVIILRESKLQNYQPKFHAPFYPWVQIAGLAGCLFFLILLGKEPLITVISLSGTGLFLYWFFGRIRTEREYALLHVIERITARELTTHSLETELKEIIRKRDDITGDRFDGVIERSIILDIEEKISMNDLFEMVAEQMGKRLGIESATFKELLIKREEQGSTVLTPYFAVPHIVINKEGTFDILLARCREGAVFSDSVSNIHAVFVLAGSKDQRNFHLRALSAIAQIVQDPEFENDWMDAKNEKTLRDIILLGRRSR